MYIEKNIEVESNTNYITCEEGEFGEFDFVLCKHKLDTADNTVMFLASQVKIQDNESSI